MENQWKPDTLIAARVPSPVERGEAGEGGVRGGVDAGLHSFSNLEGSLRRHRAPLCTYGYTQRQGKTKQSEDRKLATTSLTLLGEERWKVLDLAVLL